MHLIQFHIAHTKAPIYIAAESVTCVTESAESAETFVSHDTHQTLLAEPLDVVLQRLKDVTNVDVLHYPMVMDETADEPPEEPPNDDAGVE